MCEGAGPWVILTRINIRHCNQSHDVQLAGPRLVSSLAKMKHTGHFEAYLQCSLLASSSRGPMTDEPHTPVRHITGSPGGRSPSTLRLQKLGLLSKALLVVSLCPVPALDTDGILSPGNSWQSTGQSSTHGPHQPFPRGRSSRREKVFQQPQLQLHPLSPTFQNLGKRLSRLRKSRSKSHQQPYLLASWRRGIRGRCACDVQRAGATAGRR